MNLAGTAAVIALELRDLLLTLSSTKKLHLVKVLDRCVELQHKEVSGQENDAGPQEQIDHQL